MAELPQIIQLVEQSLDEPGLDAGELASRACLSRFYFDRLASAALGGHRAHSVAGCCWNEQRTGWYPPR